MTDHPSRAQQLLAAGRLDKARIYLEELLRQDPENPDLLYNLGLCCVDLWPTRQGGSVRKMHSTGDTISNKLKKPAQKPTIN